MKGLNFTLSELEAKGYKFVLIASDSTKYWIEDIQAKAERILTYSLVNLTQPTNLCSPDVNFPSQEVYYRFKDTSKFDEDELAFLEHRNSDDCSYFSEREVVTVVHVWNETEDEDEIVDYLMGNPIEL